MKILPDFYFHTAASLLLAWLCLGCSQTNIPVSENNFVSKKQTCIAGYVVEIEPLSWEGLSDAPLEFSYRIQIENGDKVKLTYRAYPPGPVQRKPVLSFHAGSIQINDFVEVCGQQNQTSGSIDVNLPDDYIRSYPSTVYVVVRHAEKLSDSTNTNLSPEGLLQAQSYASIFSKTLFSAAIATEFCRTAQTAQPVTLAQQLPLFIQGFDFSSNFLETCDPQISTTTQKIPAQFADLSSILGYLSDKHSPGNLFIVGHSNTVPDWVTVLSGQKICPSIIPFSTENDCQMPDHEFGHVFEIQRAKEANFGILNHQEMGL